MLGIVANGGYVIAMKIVFVVFCIGAAAFLLRVLVALVHESKSPTHHAVRAYHAKFRPRAKRGELIEMQSDAVQHRFQANTGTRIALALLVILGLANTGSVTTILFKS